ncbi:hypothetical protein BJY59DRAFT_200519 [Rhodotorula toruloides]
MADPKLEPEVASLIPNTTLTPLRIFLSLSILLVFLLIAFLSPRRRLESPVAVRAKKKGAKTVVLVGPLASGKTALFSRLVYGSAQQTHTSMRENEAVVKAKWGFGEDAVVEKGEKEEVEEPAAIALSTPLHIVDLPGHPPRAATTRSFGRRRYLLGQLCASECGRQARRTRCDPCRFVVVQGTRGVALVRAGHLLSEILALPEADAFAFEGQADWDKLEQAVGVEIQWATASVKTGRDGVERVYEWVDEL